ncbi:hypothetical protein GBV73_09790 [Thermococcus sp. 101 C5]|jgi:hypothetical protein|uniref:hypothetical protein n=1 Tax=Thermococcus TaxID=2263 RepID=UPI00128DCE9A|nr:MULTISPECIES: hypothetical protein [Thermococcus]MCA6214095.1 hypothetical protein [Thermococcus bergensis]MPW39944.1 hypothetical protein [Thermococcus sp. 101 C5]HIH72072.1 hypothetical protein [Thermococcaceae archaeon]
MNELDKAIFGVFTGSGATIAANLRPYITLALELYEAFRILREFIKWRKKEEKKKNHKRSLALIFQKKLDKARNDLEKLADDVSYAFGGTLHLLDSRTTIRTQRESPGDSQTA